MRKSEMSITNSGAVCFGIVIGWITYRTLRRAQASGLSDIATVIGAVGGAAITGLFRKDTDEFGYYCIGLIIGFFAYLISSLLLTDKSKRHAIGDWLGSETSSTSSLPPSRDGGDGGAIPPPPPRR
jgi:uncharacterized membrane protein YeaQ/YmgE (transglycosylase-associated protein family)